MKFRIEHIFEGVTLEEYEELYFREDFNVALCQAVKLARTLISREETDGHLYRAVQVGPDRELPRPVAKILGGSRLEYTEHLHYDFGSYRGTWKTIPSLLSDKVESQGGFEFSRATRGVQRLVTGEIKVKIFGVGGVVERLIVSDIEKSYEKAADFTRQWINAGKV